MDAATTRKRKSEKLTPDEFKAFKAFRKRFDLEIDCAESIGVSREVLGRALWKGSASPESIEKIRLVLQKTQDVS